MSADRRSSGLLGWQGWAAAVAIALTPSYARADVGIPMLAFAWPAAWLTLPPVVLIEGIAARRMLGLSYKEGLLLSLRANAWSTFVGIPVAWVVMLGIEMLAGLLLSTLPSTVLSESAFQLLAAPFFAAW